MDPPPGEAIQDLLVGADLRRGSRHDSGTNSFAERTHRRAPHHCRLNRGDLRRRIGPGHKSAEKIPGGVPKLGQGQRRELMVRRHISNHLVPVEDPLADSSAS